MNHQDIIMVVKKELLRSILHEWIDWCRVDNRRDTTRNKKKYCYVVTQ